jgi:hypothetical protein
MPQAAYSQSNDMALSAHLPTFNDIINYQAMLRPTLEFRLKMRTRLDHESYLPGSPTVAHDEYLWRMADQVATSCHAGRALQAANLWAWAGEGRANALKNSAGSFLGDPPCEPEG